MGHLLKPDQTAASVYAIDMQALKDKGCRHLIVDIDNTLTPWNDHQINTDLTDWIEGVKAAGFSVCLLSNNQQKKVQDFAHRLGVSAAPKGGKPSNRAFEGALIVLQGTRQDTVVIGDQVFTDILGGNRAGLYTILVDPITSREFIGTRIARWLERMIAGRRPGSHGDHS